MSRHRTPSQASGSPPSDDPHGQTKGDGKVDILDAGQSPYEGSTLSAELRDAARALGVLGRRMKATPYPFLGVAAAVGFILGGGLWGRLGRTLISAGARVALTMFVRSALSAESLAPHASSDSKGV